MSFVKRLLDKLLSLQDEIGDEKLKFYMREGEGKAGLLEIYGPDGGAYSFKVVRGKIVPASDENYNTLISMSEDTFLDILAGDMTLDEAWAKGLVRFEGKNWLYDAQRFKEGFRSLQYLIAKVWRKEPEVKP